MKTLPTKYQEIEKHVYTHDSERHSAYTTVKVVFFVFLGCECGMTKLTGFLNTAQQQ